MKMGQVSSNKVPITEHMGRRDVFTSLAQAAATATAAFTFAPTPAQAIVDYDGVKYLGGGDKVDINNANIRVFAKMPGMYPTVGGKIMSAVPKKGF